MDRVHGFDRSIGSHLIQHSQLHSRLTNQRRISVWDTCIIQMMVALLSSLLLMSNFSKSIFLILLFISYFLYLSPHHLHKLPLYLSIYLLSPFSLFLTFTLIPSLSLSIFSLSSITLSLYAPSLYPFHSYHQL